MGAMKTVISVRVEKSLLEKAKKIFAKLGLSTSAALNIFLHQVVIENGMPFEIKLDKTTIKKR